ncbi:MAG: glycosyltransferase family 4 protein [Thermoplasmataceae archaeon]
MNIGYDGYYIGETNSAFGQTQLNLITKIADIDLNINYFVFTTSEGSTLIPNKTNVYRVLIRNGRRDSLTRSRAILKSITINNISLDGFLETCEIAPKLNSNTPIFTMIHDFSQGKLEPKLSLRHIKGVVYNYLRIRTIHRSSLFFCNSQFTRKQLLELIDANQSATVFPHGCSDLFISGEENSSELDNFIDSIGNFKYFLFVGRIQVPHKNFMLLLRGFKEIISCDTNIRLFVATSQHFTKSQSKFIKENDLKVILIKNPTSLQISLLYKRAIALVLPAIYEGFGIPIIEAQYKGCPILLNDIEIFREVAGDGAIFFNGSLEDLVSKMKYMLALKDLNPIKMKEIENCQKYSWKNAAEAIYRSIMDYMRTTREQCNHRSTTTENKVP